MSTISKYTYEYRLLIRDMALQILQFDFEELMRGLSINKDPFNYYTHDEYLRFFYERELNKYGDKLKEEEG